MSTGRKERWPPEAYFEVVHLIGDSVPLNEALGKERPAKTAFYSRLREDAELAKAYEMALTLRAQGRIAKIEDVIEKVLVGKVDPQSAKVALDSLRWLAQKEDPKRYSDISRSEVSGPGGKDLIPSQEKPSDLDLARYIAWIMNRAERQIVDAGELRAISSGPAT